jgi:hypothetical protein
MLAKDSQATYVSMDGIRSYGGKAVLPCERWATNAKILGDVEMENKNGSPADDAQLATRVG